MDEPGRFALVVSSSRYADPSLRQLISPSNDADALEELLRDRKVGDFDVRWVRDQPSWEVRKHVQSFFAERRLDDVTLLYYSGHGIKDEEGSLYFAALDTDPKLLLATALSSHDMVSAMRKCRSRRQVLLLDCCYAGAFSRTMLAKSDMSVDVHERFSGEGAGRVVITASDSMQVALEGDEVVGELPLSVFTSALVEGIETGHADLNADGEISLDELYDYVYQRVRQINPNQHPTMSNLEKRGDIVIALNPHGVGVEKDKEEEEDEERQRREEEERRRREEEDRREREKREKEKREKEEREREKERQRRKRRRLLAGAAGTVLAAALLAGVIALLIDGGGDSWSRVLIGSPATSETSREEIRAIVPLPGNEAVAVGQAAENGPLRPASWAYDGAAWRRQPLLAERGSMNAVAVGSRQVLAGGFVVTETDRDAAIWVRSGATWTLICADQCAEPERQEVRGLWAVRTAEIEDRFVAVGRTNEGDTGWDGVVWLSEDGSEWRRAIELGGDLNQEITDVAEIRGRMVVVGRDGQDAAVWTSSDGSEWSRAKGNDLRGSLNRYALIEAVAKVGTKLVAVGWRGSAAAAWVSFDAGETWSAEASPHFTRRGQRMLDVAETCATPSEATAVGVDSAEGLAAVWRRRDLGTWTLVKSASFAGGARPEMNALAPTGDVLFSVGKTGSDDEPDEAIWTSKKCG